MGGRARANRDPTLLEICGERYKGMARGRGRPKGRSLKKLGERRLRDWVRLVPGLVVEHRGNMTKVSESLGIDRWSWGQYVRRHPELGDAEDLGHEMLLDIIEEQTNRAACGEVRGMNTNASTRRLAAAESRRKRWNPKQEVHVDGGGFGLDEEGPTDKSANAKKGAALSLVYGRKASGGDGECDGQ